MNIDRIQALLELKKLQLRNSINQAIDEVDSSPNLNEMIKCIGQSIFSGRRIAFAGNGGSAAEAMHIAAEFTGKCVVPHDPWPVMCLNESQSALTAIGNDYGFEHIFSRMVEAHLTKGDVLILLSTSGTSLNIIRAIESASKRGVQTYLWTGSKCATENAEFLTVLRAPATSTPRIQEIHLIWGHLLAEVIEESI